MAPSPEGDRACSPLCSCNPSVWLWGRPCKFYVRGISAPAHTFPLLAYSLPVESLRFPGGILKGSVVCRCSACRGESWGCAVPNCPRWIRPSSPNSPGSSLLPRAQAPLSSEPPLSCCPKFAGASQARSGLNKHKAFRDFSSHGAARGRREAVTLPWEMGIPGSQTGK